MQSPPRKGKLSASLRSTHNEQIAKLQTKHQQECDLLEDIKNFAKQRATIEKNYGEALLKLATQYLQKKIPMITDVPTEDGKERKSVFTIWRMVLDENEKLGKARLAATEVFQQQISDSAKTVKAQKMQVTKKCLEQLQKIQEEVQLSVRELDKMKKAYMDEEHIAHDARDKAHDAEEKLKRKKGHFFQSLSSLQKNSAKFSSKKEACDIRSTGARNDYILCLASINAQQGRYHDVDLPEIMKTMDAEAYEKVAEYFQLLSQTELFTCAATQTSYTKIKESADLITHQHNIQCYLHEWSALRDKIQYQFEPCQDDKIDYISSDHNSGHNLSKEAKRCATKIAKETKAMRAYHKQLKTLLNQSISGQKDEASGELGTQDIEQKIEEVKQNIRKAETSKLKAEAKIEVLRQGGDVESLGLLDLTGGSLSRTGSTISVKTDLSGNVDDGSSEFYDSDYNDDISDTSAIGAPVSSAPATFSETDSISEPRDTTSLLGGRSGAMASGVDTADVAEGDTTSIAFTPMRCVALYSYTAQNADELSIIEQEVLDIVGEGDGDGWVKARNSQGMEGFIPQSYVEIESGEPIPTSIYPAPTSFSSVDYTYTMPQWDDEDQTAQEAESILASQTKVLEDGTTTEVPATMVENHVNANDEVLEVREETGDGDGDSDEKITFCQALYDYEATCPEELTFAEGQTIKVLSKHVHDVDDGWWKGEVDGEIGIFPSLVVEELRNDGEPQTPIEDDEASPPSSAPPTFAPPPMPQFLSAAAQVIITQPTPETENPEEDEEEQQADFEMELSEAQQSQYQTQFTETDSNANETASEKSPHGHLKVVDEAFMSSVPSEMKQSPPSEELQEDTVGSIVADKESVADDESGKGESTSTPEAEPDELQPIELDVASELLFEEMDGNADELPDTATEQSPERNEGKEVSTEDAQDLEDIPMEKSEDCVQSKELQEDKQMASVEEPLPPPPEFEEHTG